MDKYRQSMYHQPSNFPNQQACRMPNMGVGLDQLPIAMAYVPWQQWKHTYEVDIALCRGTIFPELDLPLGKMKG